MHDFRLEDTVSLMAARIAQSSAHRAGKCALTPKEYMPSIPSMNDLLQFVQTKLAEHVGELPSVARATGMSYDTILRIKNGEGDPGYSKVRRLADHFDYRQSPCEERAA
jgi:hypothetical protein